MERNRVVKTYTYLINHLFGWGKFEPDRMKKDGSNGAKNFCHPYTWIQGGKKTLDLSEMSIIQVKTKCITFMA